MEEIKISNALSVNGMAGELGWMIIDQVPETGSIELNSSLNFKGAVILGLCGTYNDLKRAQNPEHQDITDAKFILDCEATDPDAKTAVKVFYESISKAIINLDSLFDPEAILIGGGITENSSFYNRLMETHERLVERHESYHYMVGKTACEVNVAKLKNDAGLLGAVYQVKQKVNAK